ncbi:hypothetical protein N431DRAFT_475461 [Stipitochalara longipes BDJ]|nr:hypothetical protein N431DRAFT_475461 [Stipitochalara longipes BDJ]
MSSTQVFPIFGQGVAYGFIVGLGALFADSEMYLTAKWSVKAEFIASSVVSSWTLSATLLTSTTFGYLYEISAAFWYTPFSLYGAGCSVPILAFAVLAIEFKRKAPNAHTFLELVKHRYGALGDIILVVYSLIYQIFIAVNLLVGGAEVLNIVTGMNKSAVCFLFLISICVYTHFGGIKATFTISIDSY